MSRRGSWLIGDRRGTPALEFALIAPVLLMVLGGVADYGLVLWGKGQLANGIAQGVQYALLQGPSVVGAGAGTGTVQSVVTLGAARSGVAGTVTVTVTGPACHCVAGTPAALTAAPNPLSATFTCTGTCPTPAAAPGVFVIITASYVYTALTPFYSKLATTTTVSETATVRVQ